MTAPTSPLVPRPGGTYRIPPGAAVPACPTPCALCRQAGRQPGEDVTAWATVTAMSVRVGDRVQIDTGRGKPRLLRVEDLRTARAGGKRLTLEDGSVYLLLATETLRGFVQAPQATP